MKPNPATIPIPVNNILKILEMIASRSFPDNPGPQGALKPGEKTYGIVTSPINRCFFAAADWVADAAIAIKKEHDERHECDSAHLTSADCKRSAFAQSELLARSRILGKLMWQGIHGEHPATIGNGMSLRAGWNIVKHEDSVWEDMALFPEPGDAMNTILAKLVGIMNGTATFEAVPALTKVGESEKVIGEITDKRIMAIRGLQDSLLKESHRELDFEGDPADPANEAKLKALFESKTIREVQAFMNRSRAYNNTINVLGDLFWRAVRDSTPWIDVQNMAIREGWKVVSMPDKEGDLSLESLMTEALLDGASLFGLGHGGVVIPIPTDSALAHLLMRRQR